MSNDDGVIGTALWLAAGGVVGYAAGSHLIAPHFVKPAATAPTASAPTPAKPRSLASGGSDLRVPIDPYAPIAGGYQPMATVASNSTVESFGPKVAASGFATAARVRRFDPVFQRYRGNIPIEYVRALVERESDGRPAARAGRAIGLMQIVPVVLDDYNKRHGSAYTSEHLVDPATNVAIGCELLRIIVTSYKKNHPRITTLQPDWTNPRFVELLTLGWNAGFSEAGGLGRVARYLENLGAVEIDIDQVSAHAKLAGATKHLSNPAKVAWCKSVVSLYLRERAQTAAARVA